MKLRFATTMQWLIGGLLQDLSNRLISLARRKKKFHLQKKIFLGCSFHYQNPVLPCQWSWKEHFTSANWIFFAVSLLSNSTISDYLKTESRTHLFTWARKVSFQCSIPLIIWILRINLKKKMFVEKKIFLPS